MAPLPNGIHSTQELLDAQAHVWNHIFNFINSMSLKCAVQLGIPDIIHKHTKPISLSELMDALPSINQSNKSLFVERLMRILVHSKFFTKVKASEDETTDPEEERYCLTPASRLLLRDDPLNVIPLVLLTLEPSLTDPWHHLSRWFESNDPTPFVTAHGRTFWEQAENDPWLNRLFNESMASDTRLATSVIVRDCGYIFRGLKSMVDVGGGTGSMAKAIVDAFPGIKCSVLDLAHVVAGLEGTPNLTFVGGDMFESIPPADAVLMKCILHDWPHEDCIKILKKCKQAIPGDGKVIIYDMVVDSESDEHKKPGMALMETQLLWDMQMMTLVAGKERNEKEWAKLFYDAGFTSYNIAPIVGLRSLIEVFP